MPDILHRITIDAAREDIHDLVATTGGIARWWTGRPLDGDSSVGGRFGIYFGDADTPAAVMQTESDTADEVVWRVVEGPDAWINTRLARGQRVHERLQQQLGRLPHQPEIRSRGRQLPSLSPRRDQPLDLSRQRRWPALFINDVGRARARRFLKGRSTWLSSSTSTVARPLR
jgi:hypothetical protein